MKICYSVFFILTLVTLIGAASFQSVNAESIHQDISPKKQSMSGIDIHEIQCREGYDLILKATDGSPICCKASSVDKLIQRGWAADHDTTHDIMMESMIKILPEDTINQEKSMAKAKEMMKGASENPTSVSEDMSVIVEEENTDEVTVLKIGKFEGAFLHHAEGTAQVIKMGDQTVLRFEAFEVTNGPDLRVYLTSDGDVKNGIQIDKLKGSSGDQNYVLDNIDTETYDTVVIYCQPYSVYFGKAIMS